MSKMLVVLSSGGVMDSLSDGPAPYEAVEMIDCQNGEAGDRFVFAESWRSLLTMYFKDDIPPYIQIEGDVARSDDRENQCQMLLERVRMDVATLRRVSDKPFLVPISDDGSIGIEIKPAEENSAVKVSCRFLGSTVVDYTDEGLHVDVFCVDEAVTEPLQSLWFDASELAEAPVEGQGPTG